MTSDIPLEKGLVPIVIPVSFDPQNMKFLKLLWFRFWNEDDPIDVILPGIKIVSNL